MYIDKEFLQFYIYQIHIDQKYKYYFSSFGKLCVSPNQKWKAIFRQCWASLGAGPDGKMADTQRAWESIAVALISRGPNQRPHERLQTIPQFGRDSLDVQSYKNICNYLNHVSSLQLLQVKHLFCKTKFLNN